MDSDPVRGIDRRRLLRWGGLGAAGVVAAGVPLAGAGPGHAAPAPTDPSGGNRIPRDTLPGGAFDRYVAQLAAEGRFSGVVLLSHRGHTVLSRGYGMADQENGIPNSENIAFSLSSAGQPFHGVALLQLAQQGRLRLSDPVGAHLTGFAADVAEQVTIHHLLSGTSRLVSPAADVQLVFTSRDEVLAYYEKRARQAKLGGVPGTVDTAHAEAEVTISALIVAAVAGTNYWDYVQENIFNRCGMTSSAFYTRPQWLSDPHIAHPYMLLADGSVVDALHHLDQGSPIPDMLGKNPGRAFIDAPGNGGFATAPDLVRFARAVGDGTLLQRPWADVLFGAKIPHGPTSFGAYTLAIDIVGGQWDYQRAGGNPGVAANWSIYPYTGWVAVTLINRDTDALMGILAQQTLAITGAAPSGGAGG